MRAFPIGRVLGVEHFGLVADVEPLSTDNDAVGMSAALRLERRVVEGNQLALAKLCKQALLNQREHLGRLGKPLAQRRGRQIHAVARQNLWRFGESASRRALCSR